MASQYFIEDVSCDDDSSDDEDDDDEEALLPDNAQDGFWDDDGEDDAVDLSAYAACDQMRNHKDDEATRKSFQKGIQQLKQRYRKNIRPASPKATPKTDGGASSGAAGASSGASGASGGAAGASGGAAGAQKRRLVGGRRRKKQHAKRGKIAAIFCRAAATPAATTPHRKRAAYATCANGFCKERVKPGSLWCQKHARKKQRRRNSAATQQEARALGKRRKKLAALLPVLEEKKMLMSFAFTAPGPNTCVRCGLPKVRGVMVCEKHKRLRELRSAAGVNTKATVEAALAALDKKLRALQHAANTANTRQRSPTPTSQENALTRHQCLHCKHRWLVPAGTVVDECPKCGDGNLN